VSDPVGVISVQRVAAMTTSAAFDPNGLTFAKPYATGCHGQAAEAFPFFHCHFDGPPALADGPHDLASEVCLARIPIGALRMRARVIRWRISFFGKRYPLFRDMR
jgi:hypothetical protein